MFVPQSICFWIEYVFFYSMNTVRSLHQHSMRAFHTVNCHWFSVSCQKSRFCELKKNHRCCSNTKIWLNYSLYFAKSVPDSFCAIFVSHIWIFEQMIRNLFHVKHNFIIVNEETLWSMLSLHTGQVPTERDYFFYLLTQFIHTQIRQQWKQRRHAYASVVRMRWVNKTSVLFWVLKREREREAVAEREKSNLLPVSNIISRSA